MVGSLSIAWRSVFILFFFSSVRNIRTCCPIQCLLLFPSVPIISIFFHSFFNLELICRWSFCRQLNIFLDWHNKIFCFLFRFATRIDRPNSFFATSRVLVPISSFFREFLFFLVRKWKNASSPFYFFSLFHPPPFLFLFYFRCCRADKFALCSCRWSRRTNERTATVVCGGLISLSRHFGLLGLMLGFNLIIKANKHYPRWWWSSHSFVRSLLSGSALLNIAGLSFYFSFEFLHSNTRAFGKTPVHFAWLCTAVAFFLLFFLPSFFCSFRGHCGHSNKKRQGTNERTNYEAWCYATRRRKSHVTLNGTAKGSGYCVEITRLYDLSIFFLSFFGFVPS